MNNFHVMRFHDLTGNASYKVNLVIPPDDDTNFVAPPEQDEMGVYQLVLRQPTDDARHTALGRFMDVWSKLELTISIMLGRVLGLGFGPVPALVNSLGTRGQLDVIKSLGMTGLTEQQADTFSRILDRVKENNTRRNYLAYGFWMLEWIISDRNGKPGLKPVIYRAYNPTDQETFQKLGKRENRSERKRFLYSVTRINAISRSIEQLMDDLAAFTKELAGKSDVAVAV